MTPRQKQLLEFIRAYKAEHSGVSPSILEMMIALGLHSKGGVHRLITGLEQRGLIRRLPYRARAIEIVDRRMQTCPNCGFQHRSAA